MACAASITIVWAGDDVHPPRKDTARVPRQPYERYFTTDRLGREITFYVSERPAAPTSLPLVVFVQGSGCGSCFVERTSSASFASRTENVASTPARRPRRFSGKSTTS